MMIEAMRLNFGSSQKSDPLEFDVTAVTILVGPNNSGKSLALREIEGHCRNAQISKTTKILKHFIFRRLTEEQIDKHFVELNRSYRNQNRGNDQTISVGNYDSSERVNPEALRKALSDPNENRLVFSKFFLGYKTLSLEGQNRTALTSDREAHLRRDPQSSLEKLFQDDSLRGEVRRIIHEAFGKYFVIDPTNLGRLQIKLADSPPNSSVLERGLHEEAISFHQKALPINQASDGVRAYIGIIMEIMAGDPAIVTIDEPEAFLHRALAFRLGLEAALAARAEGKRLFVATHSPQFLMGCIQSGVRINIVRLTYQDNTGYARLLSSDVLLKMMRNPLLRSTGVLSALFYNSVIVTEGDTDRAFYQEINERLIQERSGRGVPECLFLHAQSKQAMKTIIGPLRALGIPAAGIIDIDVIKEGGSVWRDLLASACIPFTDIEALGTMRQKIKLMLESTGLNMKVNGGVNLLSGEGKESANNLFDRLMEYGLFVVRYGEVESWLPSLETNGHGPEWLVRIFESMGENPDSEEYIRPTKGDVWDFIDSTARWFDNPRRKGIAP